MFTFGENSGFARSSPREQQSAGLLYLDGFSSCITEKTKPEQLVRVLLFWWRQQDSNL